MDPASTSHPAHSPSISTPTTASFAPAQVTFNPGSTPVSGAATGSSATPSSRRATNLWRDFDWLRRGTSAIVKKGRGSSSSLPQSSQFVQPSELPSPAGDAADAIFHGTHTRLPVGTKRSGSSTSSSSSSTSSGSAAHPSAPVSSGRFGAGEPPISPSSLSSHRSNETDSAARPRAVPTSRGAAAVDPAPAGTHSTSPSVTPLANSTTAPTSSSTTSTTGLKVTFPPPSASSAPSAPSAPAPESESASASASSTKPTGPIPPPPPSSSGRTSFGTHAPPSPAAPAVEAPRPTPLAPRRRNRLARNSSSAAVVAVPSRSHRASIRSQLTRGGTSPNSVGVRTQSQTDSHLLEIPRQKNAATAVEEDYGVAIPAEERDEEQEQENEAEEAEAGDGNEAEVTPRGSLDLPVPNSTTDRDPNEFPKGDSNGSSHEFLGHHSPCVHAYTSQHMPSAPRVSHPTSYPGCDGGNGVLMSTYHVTDYHVANNGASTSNEPSLRIDSVAGARRASYDSSSSSLTKSAAPRTHSPPARRRGATMDSSAAPDKQSVNPSLGKHAGGGVQELLYSTPAPSTNEAKVPFSANAQANLDSLTTYQTKAQNSSQADKGFRSAKSLEPGPAPDSGSSPSNGGDSFLSSTLDREPSPITHEGPSAGIMAIPSSFDGSDSSSSGGETEDAHYTETEGTDPSAESSGGTSPFGLNPSPVPHSGAALSALAPVAGLSGSNFASRIKAAQASSFPAATTTTTTGELESSTTESLSFSSHLASNSSVSLVPPSTITSPVPRVPWSRSSVAAAREAARPAALLTPQPSSGNPSGEMEEAVRTLGIAVVGQHTVGKSTAIREGLRNHGLTKAADDVRDSNVRDKITTYVMRCILEQEPEQVRVLEVDSSAFVGSSGREMCWPEDLGRFEGAMICYDAGHLPSLKGVPELLEFFHKHHVYTVVMACKSDQPVKAIDPFLVSELASRFGVSLAEGSSESDEGKKRVRDCFQHLIKEIAKVRVTRADEALGYAHQRSRHETSLYSTASASTLLDSTNEVDTDRDRLDDEDLSDRPGPEALSISDFLASMSVMDRDGGNEDDDLSDDDEEAKPWATRSRHRASSDASSLFPDDTTHNIDEDNDEDADDTAHLLQEVSIPPTPGHVPSDAPSPELVQSLVHRTSRRQDAAGLNAITEGKVMPNVNSAVSPGSHFPLAVFKKGRDKEPVYVPLATLLDRFFYSVVAMTNEEYLSAVLVFYRAFTHPEDLLDEFVGRFDSLSQVCDMDQALVRHALVRLIRVFHDWVRDFPGDLSPPGMQPTLHTFANRIAQKPCTATLLSALQPDLAACATAIDVDVMWSIDSSPTGPSPSSAARHDAYRQSILVRSHDQGTMSARAASEALSPSGVSMLNQTSQVSSSSGQLSTTAPTNRGQPPSSPRRAQAPRSRAASQGSRERHPAAAHSGQTSNSPLTHRSSNPSLPSRSSNLAATTAASTASEAADRPSTVPIESDPTTTRARSSSVLTVSSGQESVKSWWTGDSVNHDGTTSPQTSSVAPAGTSASSTTSGSNRTAMAGQRGTSDTQPKDRADQEQTDEQAGSNEPSTQGSQSLQNKKSYSSVAGPSTSTSTSNGAGANSTVPAPMREAGKLTMREVSNGILQADEGELAAELTRIEWDLFRVIGPRDYLRHALVDRRKRIPDGLVAKSITYFNYVSDLVASYILVQPKVKTRARMLEKMIRLAVRLRMYNNYNTLQAVLAGINSTAVHRLRHTRAMVQENKELHKRFLSLVRLMRPERAWGAYRLALENSSGRIIPFIGVHLHDILSTNDGNVSRRPLDGAVHWRKFTLLHDAIGTLARAQRAGLSAPDIEPRSELTRLVLDVPIFEEEEAWQRSLTIEPKTTNTAQSLLRKMQGS